ncbi:MAG: polyamine ABC transporter substrate-binding protein [Candidatus Roseilinea sp.]|uniref:polyamine ABC transporter substrate-binding protein n=1 Tax=Candidatus Roseilinea sp. TaxID=2838777 RepID=UPI0040491B09
MRNEFKWFRAPAALVGAIALLMSACGAPATVTVAPPTAAAPASTETEPAAQDGVDRSRLSSELSIYSWSEYIAPEVVEKFEAEYGVKVTIDSYEDNESLFAKFQAGGNPGYDLVLPSDYMIEKMIKAGMLDKIDWANVPNIRNIGPEHLNLYFDPNQEYSVPYFWGTTGIAYDTNRVSGEITSWRDIFEPADDIKGRIGLLNDQRETIGAALRYLGHSANSVDPKEIEAARNLLLEHKRYVAGYYDSIVARDNLVSGDVVVAMTYPGDAMVAAQQKSSIKYIIPEDGATIWQDSWCIPAGAPHKYTAEVFLNFMLRPDIAAENANLMGYPTTNHEAIRQGLIDSALSENKFVYPDLDAWGDRLEFLKHFDGDTQALYDRAWTEIGIGQ